MSNKPQPAMDHDFLDGIDDQFQKLMKLHGNGTRNGRSAGRLREDPLTTEIITLLQGLSSRQKEEVLAYIHSLKKAE